MNGQGITRRQFVKSASAAAAGGFLLGGCMPYQSGTVRLVDGETVVNPPDEVPPDSVLLGLYTPSTATDAKAAVRAVCQRMLQCLLIDIGNDQHLFALCILYRNRHYLGARLADLLQFGEINR